MNLRSVLGPIALGAVVAMSACSVSNGPATAVVPVPAVAASVPTMSSFGHQLCGALANGDKRGAGALLLARVGHAEAGKTPFQEAVEQVNIGCPDLAPGLTAEGLSNAYSPSNVESSESTSGDEQLRYGCEQGYITEGC